MELSCLFCCLNLIPLVVLPYRKVTSTGQVGVAHRDHNCNSLATLIISSATELEINLIEMRCEIPSAEEIQSEQVNIRFGGLRGFRATAIDFDS
jgi:hypothetical protein